MILKNHGWTFLDFLSIEEKELHRFHPIAGSFAVIICEGKILLCYNSWREQWEIPAGKREQNETAAECALRELYEETGQIPAKLTFQGLMKVKKADGTLKYNPIFIGSLKELQTFKENEETSEIMLWDREEGIGVIDEVDYRLLQTLENQFTR
ncbi:NUDIX domain-containing protein [Bacillus sp. SCS-153A]|uniref:NUDIX domain-containing protein n=1 Tax=Rossellomorea sedimentorum TaxID=3115294 RepID=UPI0039058645